MGASSEYASSRVAGKARSGSGIKVIKLKNKKSPPVGLLPPRIAKPAVVNEPESVGLALGNVFISDPVEKDKPEPID